MGLSLVLHREYSRPRHCLRRHCDRGRSDKEYSCYTYDGTCDTCYKYAEDILVLMLVVLSLGKETLVVVTFPAET